MLWKLVYRYLFAAEKASDTAVLGAMVTREDVAKTYAAGGARGWTAFALVVLEVAATNLHLAELARDEGLWTATTEHVGLKLLIGDTLMAMLACYLQRGKLFLKKCMCAPDCVILTLQGASIAVALDALQAEVSLALRALARGHKNVQTYAARESLDVLMIFI